MRTMQLTAAAFVLFCSQVFSTALSDSAAKMSPGTWLLFHNNGQRGFGGGAGELLDACDGFHTILEWTGKAAWDPTSDEFVFVGQGHYACQKYIRYSASQNQWRTKPDPSWTGGIGHAYFNNTINPANGDHYYKKYGGQDVYKRSGSTGTWTTLPKNTLVQYWQCCTAMEYFPEMNGFVLINGTEFTAGRGNVYFFNGSQWSTLATNLSLSDYSNQIMYNPMHKVVIFGRSSLYKISASGQVTALGNPPVAIGDGDGQGRFTYDPASGKYLVLAGDGLYEYDVVADSWRKTSTSTPPVSSGGYVTFDIIVAPVASCGVTMWVKWNYNNSRVFLYKHAAGNTTADRMPLKSAPEIAVSPNPFRSSINIRLPEGANACSIHDMNGRLLKQFAPDGAKSLTWNAGTAPAGVYLLRVSSGREVHVKRLLLQK